MYPVRRQNKRILNTNFRSRREHLFVLFQRSTSFFKPYIYFILWSLGALDHEMSAEFVRATHSVTVVTLSLLHQHHRCRQSRLVGKEELVIFN